MINTAAMLGLGNDPALKELAQVKAGIQVLFKLKEKDYKEMQRESRRQKEQDKREAQDIDRILTAEAREMERIKAALKTSEGGLMAALLGGAALLGAIGIVKGFNLGEFISDLKDNLVNLLGMKKVPTKPTMEEDKVQTTDTSGTDDGQELGDLSNLEAGDPNFKGLPMPDTVAVTSKMGMRGGRLHAGVDIGGVGGEKLTVSRPSQVVENRWYSGYGNTVIFKDNRGEHLYAHMRALSKFKKGDVVQPGQTIGILGNTGRSSGPHLHWEFSPRLGEVGTQGRKLKDVSDPTKSAGMTWKTPFIGKQSGGQVGTDKSGKKDQWGINIGPGYTGMTNLTKKTTGDKGDKTAKPPYGEKHLVKYMNQGGIKDKNERAMFMAQMAHESGNFKYHTELKPKSYYEGNKNLANLQKGDGLRYLGRGYIQLTGRWNYDDLRKETGLPLVAKPELAAETENAGKIALKYWQAARREPMRAAARKGDVKGATTMINKNHKGLADRTKKFGIYKAKGLQSGGPVTDAPVHRFQSGGNVRSTGKTPELYEKYDEGFVSRQARKATNSPIIIVNNVVTAPSPAAPQPAKPMNLAGGGDSMPSYSDIAQMYYRYVGGIKV